MPWTPSCISAVKVYAYVLKLLPRYQVVVIVLVFMQTGHQTLGV